MSYFPVSTLERIADALERIAKAADVYVANDEAQRAVARKLREARDAEAERIANLAQLVEGRDHG